MPLLSQQPYKARDFKISGIDGISDRTIQMHLTLYQGYVKNTNAVTQRLEQFLREGWTAAPDHPEYAALTRQLGFEYGGMVLHEYYFGNLKANGGALDNNSRLGQAIQQSFGNVDTWMKDFRAISAMRGVGWAIMYQDPMTGQLSNHWIDLHQNGVPSGFKPILVLDCWEHAFLLDYAPADRPKYVDAFFRNVDWSAVESRLTSEKAIRPTAEQW